ncbi:hypothetical protein [Agromyces sp. NPDC058064]|uniref:hypothetical protein n=1 Tax=Agromyces sp. NPDC058064 TaxID=3346322 RepID=UPI0036D94D70
MSNLNATDAEGGWPADTTGAMRSSDDRNRGTQSAGADAGEAAHHVVDTAKQETRSVASEVGRQAKKLAGQVGDEFRGQAAMQQTRAADALHAAGTSFSRMADGSDDSGYAPQIVRAAGERVDAVATWLGTRDPAGVVDEVKRFARRRPGVFIAVAVGAGLVVGRLVRALASSSNDEPSGSTAGALDPGSTTRSGAATGLRPGDSVPSDPFDAPSVPPLRETPARGATTVGVTGTGSGGPAPGVGGETGDLP